jgi:hypothetical protein
MSPKPVLLLCGGAQSSGSSLVSWCFLQRPDVDGVFDANGDMVFTPPQGLSAPYLWYKTTISSFRLLEQVACAEDEGYEVRPLLVVRDVRVVWASLAAKPYGLNGTTAEDPPLRLRLRRFLEDWEAFRSRGWPLVQYERFVREPEPVLREACAALGLAWDDAMVRWPKPPAQIANLHHGNATFRASMQGDLLSTLRPDGLDRIAHPIPADDLAWLEGAFGEFNRVHGYAPHRDAPAAAEPRLVPNFFVTRRLKWRLRQKPLRHLLWRLGFKSAASLPGTIRGKG